MRFASGFRTRATRMKKPKESCGYKANRVPAVNLNFEDSSRRITQSAFLPSPWTRCCHEQDWIHPLLLGPKCPSTRLLRGPQTSTELQAKTLQDSNAGHDSHGNEMPRAVGGTPPHRNGYARGPTAPPACSDREPTPGREQASSQPGPDPGPGKGRASGRGLQNRKMLWRAPEKCDLEPAT